MDDVKRRPGRPPKPAIRTELPQGKWLDPAHMNHGPIPTITNANGELPASVTLAHLYSYYADDGLLRTWGQGVVVTDPAEIADLIARGAPLK